MLLKTRPATSSSPSESSNHKEPSKRRASSAPRVSRLVKLAAPAAAGSAAGAERAPSPLHHACIPLDKSSASIDLPKPSPAASDQRRSFKAVASPARARTNIDPRGAKISELLAQLNRVQEDLSNAREHLASIEQDKAQALEDLAVARRLADEAYGKLEESLAARRRAEEALELERFKATEREQSAIELAQRTEEEWRRKHDAVQRRHSEDAAALVAAAGELERAKVELAAAAQAKSSAQDRADEAQRVADDNARKVEALMAEVARLRSRLDAELETKAREAAEAIGELERETSELRAVVTRSRAAEEKLATAEGLVEALKVDIAYAKRAEADAGKSAQEWKAKAGSLETRLEEVSRLNKRNEESLVSLTKSFEDCTSMLQDKQAQVLQLKEKMASLEKVASEYREGFLDTNDGVKP